MLAEEIKIKTLRRQREFIEEALTQMCENPDGSTAYRYVGQLYDEVIEYFRSEGFNVRRVESEYLILITQGLPLYVFTVGDIELSDEELKKAEEYGANKKDTDFSDELDKTIKALFNLSD